MKQMNARKYSNICRLVRKMKQREKEQDFHQNKKIFLYICTLEFPFSFESRKLSAFILYFYVLS